MTDYHSEIAEGNIDRRKEFLKNHGGWDSVKDKINSWTLEDIKLSRGASKSDIEAAEKRFKDYLNTKKQDLRRCSIMNNKEYNNSDFSIIDVIFRICWIKNI